MIPLIYVAGRYRAPTREAIAQNINAARQVGTSAALLGWYPVIPHANTAHMELNTPHGDEFWLDGTLELMTRCDAVVLVPGWESSEGTKGEIAKARRLGLTVFEALDDLPLASAFVSGESARLVVSEKQLKAVHRDLDACQKVIWLAGCGPRGAGFDPAYCTDAQARLKEIDGWIAAKAGG